MKIVAIIFFISASLPQGLACSMWPLSFCYTNSIRPNDIVVSGRIIAVDTNGINLEIIDVLRGAENRDTIRIWDGTDFDCNGIWSMAASDLGSIDDSIIIILPIIDSIENTWDVLGDYRRPVYFGYECDMNIVNDTVRGYLIGDSAHSYLANEIQPKMSYSDFKDYWISHSNDCITLVGINEVAENNIVSYTNPINSICELEFQNKNSQERTLVIYSEDGRKLKAMVYSSNKIEIDFSNFSDGLYFITIHERNGKQVAFKVIKNNY